MKTYPTEKIRNVALVGHGGSGKTTLAEALLFDAGAIPRMGRVEDGTTVTDFDPEEAQAPDLGVAGHRAVRARGPQGQRDRHARLRRLRERRRGRACGRPTSRCSWCRRSKASRCRPRLVWRMADELGLPRAVFVNKLDRERASFSRTLDELKDKFGAGVAPLQLPIGEEADFHGVVELLDDDAVTTYVDGKATEGPVPAEMEMEEHSVHDALDRGHRRRRRRPHGALPRRRDHRRRRARARAGRGRGVGDRCSRCCAAARRSSSASTGSRTSSPRRAPTPDASATAPPVAFVFKTIVDPYVGHVNLFKVLQGTVQDRRHARERPHGAEERLHQLSMHARQGAGADVRGARGRHRRGRQARPTPRPATCSARAAPTSSVEPFEPPAPVLAVAIRRQVEERRGQARQRAAPPARRGPRAARSNATRRPTRRCSGAWARRTSASRSSACTASSASRSRPRT